MRVMDLFGDRVAPLRPQLISGTDATTLWVGHRGRKVIAMPDFFPRAGILDCLMQKVNATAVTPALPLLPSGNNRVLCTGGDVFQFQLLECERHLFLHRSRNTITGSQCGIS